MPIIRTSGEGDKKKDNGDEIKRDLLRNLGEFETLAPGLEEYAQGLIRSLRVARDVIPPVREVIQRLPPHALTEDDLWSAHEAWRGLLDGTRELEKRLPTMVNTFNALSSGTTVASTQVIVGAKVFFPGPSPELEAVKAAEARIFQIFAGEPLVEQARKSMDRLGLTSPRSGGYRTPSSLLGEAQAAFDRPTYGEGGPVSVLISLRGCIELVITELLLRTPVPVGKKWNQKVASLGQCSQPSLSAGHFDRLGADVDVLINDLSKAKDATMTRQEISNQFHRGLQVLNALMDAIDGSQLKAP